MRPIPDQIAHVRITGDGGRIAFVPIEGASIRAIETAFLRAGLTPFVSRSPHQAILPVEQYPEAEAALSGWSISLSPEVEQAVTNLGESETRLRRGRDAVSALNDPEVASQSLEGFPELSLLDPHQVVAVAAATHPDVVGLCLFDEQGLGKTIEGLFSFHRLFQLGEIRRGVVFAPKNMVLEWKNDLERMLPGRYRVTTVAGSQKEKTRALSQDSDIFVTNFETARSHSVQLRQRLKERDGKSLLIVDESFFVKNPESIRSKAIRELRHHAARCLVLCGTPAPNSPHDLVEQFNIADGGIAFRGVQIPEDHDPARDIIRQVINERGVFLRRLKQEVLPDLPGRTFHRVILPMEEGQERLYKTALRSLIHSVKAVDEGTFRRRLTTFMGQRVALLQICSNPSLISDEYFATPAKLVAMDNILEELVERRKEKVVVWSYFTRSLHGIMARYAKYNPVLVDGSVSAVEDRREAVRKFQTDNETMLFVANPAAAGAGLTLHRARFAVYESFSNQAAHYLQSLDRIHRRGQTRDVEYLILLCDQTLEFSEFDRLLRKEAAAQELLGDEVAHLVTKESFLEELLTSARGLGLGETEPVEASIASGHP
jgi:SNF2 family DNA or RNA helicase